MGWVGVPFNSRLAIPVSAPAGGNSTIAEMPNSRMVAVHRSQRTGRVSCATSLVIASVAEDTGRPSAFDSSVTLGEEISAGVIRLATVV